jgi:hypothetical protein
MNFYEDDEDEGDIIDVGYFYKNRKKYNNVKTIFEDAITTFYHIVPTGYKRSGFFYKVKDDSDIAKLMYGINDFDEEHYIVVYLTELGSTRKELIDLFNNNQIGCMLKTEMFDDEKKATKFYKKILSEYIGKMIEKGN